MDQERFDFTKSRLKDVAKSFKEAFLGLNFSQINNVLVETFAEKVESIKPSEVLKNYSENRLCTHSEISPRDLNYINSIFYSVLPEEYELLEISPVAPIGTTSSVTKIDQKTILSTIRNVEVVSDPSTILALESAKRRKLHKSNIIHLATSHTSMRLQKFTKSHMRPFFSGMVISTAGQDTGNRNFEFSQTKNQIETWLDFFEELNSNNKYSISNISVGISDTSIIDKLIENGYLDREIVTSKIRNPDSAHLFNQNNIDIPVKTENIDEDYFSNYPFLKKTLYKLTEFDNNILSQLKNKYPNIQFYFDLGRSSGTGYFDGILFKIRGTNKDGKVFNLVDGGLCNWTAKLLSNNKEQFITSGAGTNVIIGNFKL